MTTRGSGCCGSFAGHRASGDLTAGPDGAVVRAGHGHDQDRDGMGLGSPITFCKARYALLTRFRALLHCCSRSSNDSLISLPFQPLWRWGGRLRPRPRVPQTARLRASLGACRCDGPAVVLMNGIEIPVTASQAGLIRTDSAADLFDALPGILRKPDGREAEFAWARPAWTARQAAANSPLRYSVGWSSSAASRRRCGPYSGSARAAANWAVR